MLVTGSSLSAQVEGLVLSRCGHELYSYETPTDLLFGRRVKIYKYQADRRV